MTSGSQNANALDGAAIFVAGATGLAGSAAVRGILDASSSCRVVAAHYSDGGAFIHDPRVNYIRADLRVLDDCIRATAGCSLAVLAAAQTGGSRASATAPWKQVTANVVIDANLLDALHTNHVARAVYVSTASVYQPFDGMISEDELDWNENPHDTYFGVGWVKRYGEKACEFWHRKTGLEVVILRLANIFGPFARFDPAMSNFIPALVRKAVEGMNPLEVWGSPEVTRDVIYSDDFAAAVVAALSGEDISFDVFNIGSGVRTTVGDVVRWVLEASPSAPVNVVYGDSEPTALTFRALDVSKAAKMLNWTARVPIQKGVHQTVEWWRRNKDAWTR